MHPKQEGIAISHYLRVLVCPLIVVVVFLALTHWTWHRTPDLLIDFGRELYVPWRLSEGDVLYRDLAYFNGPLSPIWHATLFSFAGTSITTICMSNLLAMAALTLVMYGWITRRYDRLTALTTCLVFMFLFGFAHLIVIGNYNFVTPYSHELTHGVILAAMIFVLLTSGETSRKRFVLSGVLWGAVFLGKPEVFLATTAMIVVLLLGRAGLGRRSWIQSLLDGASLLLSAAIVVGGFALYFSNHMPWQQAWLSVSGGWRFLLASDAVDSPFYRAVAGLDEPWSSARRVMLGVLVVGALAGAIALLQRWRQTNDGRFLALGLLGGVFSLAIRQKLLPWVLIPESLLVFCVVIAALITIRFFYQPVDTPERLLAGLAWSVYAGFMLGKVVLAPRFQHYGFALAMPATVLFVVWLVGELTQARRTTNRPVAGMVLRYLVVSLVLFDAAYYWRQSERFLRQKTYQVGQGQDVIAGFDPAFRPIAETVDELLDYMAQHILPEMTFSAVPEGVMLNYLTRRINPTGHINLMPPELAMFGESRILASYRHAPPEYIAVVHKDTGEYGVRFFGQDGYGEQIMSWIQSHYVPVTTFGADPLVDDRFGIQLLKLAPVR